MRNKSLVLSCISDTRPGMRLTKYTTAIAANYSPLSKNIISHHAQNCQGNIAQIQRVDCTSKLFRQNKQAIGLYAAIQMFFEQYNETTSIQSVYR